MTSENIPYYEYIVVGCGGIGSAAVYWLSRRAGAGVLGLEQFHLGHDNGGSQDHSRIIRLMYHEEKYTKLTPDTYTAWAEVEKESGIQLVYKTGSLDLSSVNTPGAKTMANYATSMEKQNIRFERLSSSQLSKRYPQFRGPDVDELEALYQPDGGLVDAAMGNAVHIQLAQARGATVIDRCPVTRIETLPDGRALVHSTLGTFKCRRVIVTSGAWSNHVMGSVGVHIPLVVTQEQVTYYSTPNIKEYTKEKFPIFIYHGENDYYGLPIHGNSCSKIGIDAAGPPVTPDTRTFVPDEEREKRCEGFLKKFMPSYLGPISYSKTCLYAMPYDRAFVIDTLAGRSKPQVVFCIGAGHAYKFAGLFGRILSELAVDGRTLYPIEPFTMDRPEINDPNFKPIFSAGLSKAPPPTARSSKL